MAQSQQNLPRQKRIQRIQLEPYDDVVSVRDRLQFVNAGRVLLVFPANSKILRRKLDLVLIQREAARRDLRLALVTSDPDIASHAKELNISAFFTIEQARTQRWKRPRNKVFIDREDRPRPEHDPYELMQVASRLKPPPSPKKQAVRRAIRGVIFGAAVLLLLFGIYAILPSATVTITPASDQLSEVIDVTADPSINQAIPESKRIPAETRQFLQDGTATIETTGRRTAESELAEGKVVFTNDTGLATFVPAGTVVQTIDAPPIQFETLEDVALPARQGATIEVNIRALENSNGLRGNVDIGEIARVTGPLEGSVSVTNPNPTFGAGVREAAFVTQQDYDRLVTLARQQVLTNAQTTLKLAADADQYYVISDLQIVGEPQLFYSAALNEPVDSVSLTMQATVATTVINLDEARLIANAYLASFVTPGNELFERASVRVGQIQSPAADGTIALTLRVDGSTRVAIDANEVRDRLAGKSENEAREMLNRQYTLDPDEPIEISTWPSFLNRLPILPVRISVHIRGG